VVGAIVNAPLRAADPAYPQQQRVQPCSGRRYGEIVAVIDTPGRLAVRGSDTDGQYLDDPNWDRCHRTIRDYLGIPGQPLSGTWEVSVMVTVALFSPTSRQQSAGQHWASCVVSPQTVDGGATTIGSSSAEYDGPLRGALHTGNERNRIGYCAVSADLTAGVESTSCGTPHVLEVFGYGASGNRPVTRGQLETTCRRAVEQLTGDPDRDHADGLRTVVGITDGAGVPIIGTRIPEHSDVVCALAATGGRKLTGSLLALGRQPIPWA
jgi:hypothetical protein